MTGATFDRGRYESTVRRIGDLVGDLWAVDEALAYCRDLECRSPFGDAREDVAWVEVRIGRTHPFDKRVAVPVASGGGSRTFNGATLGAHRQAAEEYVDGLQARGEALGDRVTSYLQESFRDIVRPVPSAFEEAAGLVTTELVRPMGSLVSDDFARLANNLGSWRGQGAERFADTFYNPVQQCVDNQVFLARGLVFGLAGCKAIVHQGQHSVMGLVLSAERVLDDQLSARQAEHAPTATSPAEWLTLAATAAFIVAAVPTAGASLAAAVGSAAAVTGSLLSYSSTQVEDGEVESFAAMSAEEAHDELVRGVENVRERYRRQWSVLEEQIGSLHALTAAVEEEHLLYPRRPHFTAGGSEEFRHESAPR